MDKDDAVELLRRFQIVCRQCQSDDVVVDIESAQYGSDDTGCYSDGRLAVGCNNCKQNDLFVSWH